MTPRFSVGDGVRIARERPARGHVRAPRYVRGKVGVVERICGAFRNPEDLAYGVWDGPVFPLYRVRLFLSDLWPQDAEAPLDTVDVDVYEHWLEPVEDA